jgi:hypothetical protein
MSNKEIELIDDFAEIYRLYAEVVHNHERGGFIGLINKLKPESKSPIKDEYIDFQKEMDGSLRYFKRKMLKLIRFKNYL